MKVHSRSYLAEVQDQGAKAEREAVLAWLEKQAKDSYAMPGLAGSDRQVMNAIGDVFVKIRQAIANGEHRKEGAN